MSADARVWCEHQDTENWTGWADGTSVRPRGGLVSVILKLEDEAGCSFHWIPTEHHNGTAISGYIVPRRRPRLRITSRDDMGGVGTVPVIPRQDGPDEAG